MVPRPADTYIEEVEVRGHIIDSLILPKILDCIMSSGGAFRIKQITIGQARTDPSYALIEIRAADRPLLDRILAQIADHGAVADRAAGLPAGRRPTSTGRFPKGSTAPPTSGPRFGWPASGLPVEDQEMDCGIVVDPARGHARGVCR